MLLHLLTSRKHNLRIKQCYSNMEHTLLQAFLKVFGVWGNKDAYGLPNYEMAGRKFPPYNDSLDSQKRAGGIGARFANGACLHALKCFSCAFTIIPSAVVMLF